MSAGVVNLVPMARTPKIPSGIRQRGDKFQVRFRDADGRQRAKTFSDLDAARSYLERAKVEVEDGKWRDPRDGKTRFADVAETWRRSKDSLRPGTQANIDSLLSAHILPALGRRQIGNVTPKDIRTWAADLRANGVGQTSIAKAWRIVEDVFDLAVEDRLIAASPVPRRGRPTTPKTPEMRFLLPEEYQELLGALDATGNGYYVPLITTLANTGARWGELVGLHAKNLDLLHRQLRIETQLTDVSGRLVESAPKTPTSRRTITVPKMLVPILEPVLPTAGDAYVFTTPAGTPLRQANFRKRVWLPAVKAAGLAPLRVHDLRHTHVSWLVASGADALEVCRRLGHTRPSFTLSQYGHLWPRADEDLADRLDLLHEQTSARPSAPVRRLGTN